MTSLMCTGQFVTRAKVPALSSYKSGKSFMVVICVLLLISGVNANESLIQHWTSGFTGLKPSTGHVDMLTAKSLIQCANQCGVNSMCISIFFVEDSRLCQIYAQTFQSASPGLSFESSAVYYERDVPDTATPTSTSTSTIATTTTTSIAPPTTTTQTATSTTTPPTSATTTTTTTPTTSSTTASTPNPFCPADDSVFTSVLLPSGIEFQYRVFMDMPRNYSESETVCSDLGAEMYRIITVEKFTFTQGLMTCAAYSSFAFWVDGVYNAGTSKWVTSDGSQIPMTSDFWAPNRPNNPGLTNCVWMYHEFGHYLDDYYCNKKDAFTICEIEL